MDRHYSSADDTRKGGMASFKGVRSGSEKDRQRETKSRGGSGKGAAAQLEREVKVIYYNPTYALFMCGGVLAIIKLDALYKCTGTES